MRLAEALQAKLVELELAEREVTDADVQEVLSGLKRFQQTLRMLDQKVTEATIPINETLPIAIAYCGDWHVGAYGCNYEQLEDDIDLMASTPGLYSIGMGDYADNYLPGRIPTGMLEMTVPPAVQEKLVLFLAQKMSPLAWIRGCHDDFAHQSSDRDSIQVMCDLTGGAINLWHGGKLTLKLGEQTYTIHARHKTQGESGLNSTNAQRRLLDMHGIVDVVAIAHKHYPDMQAVTRHGQPVTYLRSGCYKPYDEYGQKLAGYRGQQSVPVTILFPDEHKVVPFRELRDGVKFLKALRG